MSCSLSELPGPAIRTLISRARSRCIPGTNKLALVCRSWHQASYRCSDDERLHLCFDGWEISDTDLEACMGWLQLHGYSVVGLSVSKFNGHTWDVSEPRLFSPVMFSSNLTHLDLPHTDLQLFKGVLQQLPGLQHLSAYLDDVTASDPAELLGDGSSADCLADAPDLCRLCPQLISLRLDICPQPDWDVGYVDSYSHPGLLQLLPGGLQKLHLEGERLVADGSHFIHLTAMEHLILDTRCLINARHLAAMPTLQRVQLCMEREDYAGSTNTADVLPFASKPQLVELCSCWEEPLLVPLAVVQQLTALTALHIEEPELEEGQVPPAVNPLVNLPSLHHLYLSLASHDRDTRGWLLRGLSSVSSLRCLQLSNCHVSCVERLCAVSELRQLTTLWLKQLPKAEAPGDRDAVFASMSHAVQQLTGLQQLALDYDLLLASSPLLTHLQQLTQLLVLMNDVELPKDVQECTGCPGLHTCGWRRLVQEVAPLLTQGQGSPRLQRLVLVDATCWMAEEERTCQSDYEVAWPTLPGVRVTLAGVSRRSSAEYWRRAVLRPQPQLRPCPHLAGVCEVVSQV